MEFTINYKITGIDSLNKIYSGEHWGKRNDYTSKVKMVIKAAMRKSGVKGNFCKSPVIVIIIYPPDRLDIDNHGYFSKCVIDTLKGVIIPDDNKKHVIGLLQVFGDRDNILVRVEELGSDYYVI